MYFKVASNQAILTYTGNLVTSAKFLGSGMKCDTSDTDYTKLRNGFFSLFITAVKFFLKIFQYSLLIVLILSIKCFVCLIWSRIFNLASAVYQVVVTLVG